MSSLSPLIITSHTFSQQMSRAKLDTVVETAHSLSSIQWLKSTSPFSGCTQWQTYSSLLLQQQFSEASEDPKGSVSADRQDGEMQKQSSLSVFPWRCDLKFVLENNQGNVILHSAVNNQQQPTSRFYRTQHITFVAESLRQLCFFGNSDYWQWKRSCLGCWG